MTDYKNGLIYTIRSPHTDNIYIGSTCQRLSKRLYMHRNGYNSHKNGSGKYTSSHKIIEFGDEYIELLETYPCNSKIELHKREGELIREYKDVCVNMCVAGRTKKQWRMENKERIEQYYEDNKEHIKQYRQQYRCDNKEQIKEYREKNKEHMKQYYQENKERYKQYKCDNKEQIKQYRCDNKEQINEYSKQYYQKNKTRYAEIHHCDCGGHYRLKHKPRHEKSKKHLNYMSNPFINMNL